MASELHWFPFYTEDWLGSKAISMMLPEQEGAYLRLLALAWGDASVEPSLPTDSRALALMSRLGTRWKKLGALIVAQFVEKDDRLYNVRLSMVWQEQQLKHAKAITKASVGGKARAEKYRALKGDPPAPSSTPSSTPSSASSSASSSAPSSASSVLTQNLEEAVEQSPSDFVLLASAPDGALALDAPRSPAANRAGNSNGKHSNGALNASAILAKRSANAAEGRTRTDRVARWCAAHPDAAATLRAELAREFRGDDPIVVNAREAAFESQVVRRIEATESPYA